MLIHAQNGQVNFDFDFARFGYDSTSNYVEFYYSFRQNSLKLQKRPDGFYISARLHIEITDTLSGNQLLNKNWKIDNIVDTSQIRQNKSLLGLIGFVIPKGTYRCSVYGSDGLDTLRGKQIVETIDIKPLIDGRMAVSDIELSTNIKQEGSDTSSIFYKNTLEVVPNPIMIFGEGAPVLYYYAELYNLKNTGSSTPISVRTYIYNSRGERLSEKVKTIARGNDSRVEVGTFNLNKLPTDTYSLVVSAVDSGSNVGVASSKRFYVYNPSVKDTVRREVNNTDFLSSEFGILSTEEADNLFDYSKYIASSKEVSQYSKLQTPESKREFLFHFWKKRDNNPNTPENEFKDKYMERVRLSNERFGTINRKGMKTDRGRVYIVYGDPDEIDRYPSEVDKKPYEVWSYNQIEGGVVFIFGDVTGFSDYELLHSTKRGELRDDNWLRRIQSN